jgi:hypothetical protein
MKYIKPQARNLGNISDAKGYCIFGSVANIATDTNCFAGASAIGAYCGFGGTPNPNGALGCQSGLIPGYNGCNTGLGNTTNCSFGQTPT